MWFVGPSMNKLGQKGKPQDAKFITNRFPIYPIFDAWQIIILKEYCVALGAHQLVT